MAIALTSADSICHLAEELKDASKWLPRCMVGAAALNFTIGFLMLITLLFRAGSISDAINSPTGQPYIEILLNATGSVAGTAVMVAYVILALMFCAINMVTTSSRQLYSFARDGGLPFAKTLSKVRVCLHRLECPLTHEPGLSTDSHPNQRNHGHSDLHRSPLARPYRLRYRVQHHRVPRRQCDPEQLYNFHYLHRISQDYWIQAPTDSVSTREGWYTDQHLGVVLPVACIRAGILSRGTRSNS